MKKNTVFVLSAFLVGYTLLFSSRVSPVIAQTILLKDVRFSSSADTFRFVMDLSAAPKYQAQFRDNVLSIVLEGTQTEWSPENIQTGDASVLKIETRSSPGDGLLYFDLHLAYPMPYRIFRLVNPDRLAVDMMKHFEEKTVLFADAFIEFSEVRTSGDSGLLSYAALRFSPSHDPFRIAPVLANSIFSREKLSSLVQKGGAIAGINGGFFSKEGKPLGLIATDGNVHTENLFHRSCFVEKKSGQFGIENIEVEVYARGDDGQTLKLSGINKERKDNDIILFTPAFGTSTKTNAWGTEFSVSGGAALEKDPALNNTAIPQDGFVFSLGAKRADAASFFGTGRKMEVIFHLKPENDYKNILCAGPRLIKDGALAVASKEEQFKPDVAKGKAPRTAIGITKTGEIIMLVVDGRNAQKSGGITLQELAHLMAKLGAEHALNLDGGGSSTMVIGDMVVNTPSDGTERKIATALLVFKDAGPSAPENSAWFSEMFFKKPLPIPIFSEGR